MSEPSMGTKPPSIGISRWKKPKLYGTVVALYFVSMAALLISYFVLGPHADNPTVSVGTDVTFGIVISSPVLAIRLFSAVRLIDHKESSHTEDYGFFTLFIWSLISGYFLFIISWNGGDPLPYPDNLPIEGFTIWYAMAFSLLAVNGLMYIFLYKRYPSHAS